MSDVLIIKQIAGLSFVITEDDIFSLISKQSKKSPTLEKITKPVLRWLYNWIRAHAYDEYIVFMHARKLSQSRDPSLPTNQYYRDEVMAFIAKILREKTDNFRNFTVVSRPDFVLRQPAALAYLYRPTLADISFWKPTETNYSHGVRKETYEHATSARVSNRMRSTKGSLTW